MIDPGEEGDEVVYLQDFVFDTEAVPFPTILLVGKRFSGKSYAAVSIAKKFDIPKWVAFCGTQDTANFWADKFESTATVRTGRVLDHLDYLTKIIQYQDRKARLYDKVLKQEFPRKYYIGFIFDDCSSDRQFAKSPLLGKLMSNGRHYRSPVLISCQYVTQLPPETRSNTDFVVMMHNGKRTCKLLFEEYVECDNLASFIALLRGVTGQRDTNGKRMYNALVYDMIVNSDRLEDVFKIYRTEPKPVIDQMKLGWEGWREYNKAHHVDREEEAEKQEIRKRRRKERLTEYREQQQARRGRWGEPPGARCELDDFGDDSDSDGPTDHDVVKMGKRHGPKREVHLPRPRPTRPSAVSETPYQSRDFASPPDPYGLPASYSLSPDAYQTPDHSYSYRPSMRELVEQHSRYMPMQYAA